MQDKQAYIFTHTRKSTFEDKQKHLNSGGEFLNRTVQYPTSAPSVPGWEGASQVHGRWWVRGAHAHWSIPTPMTSQVWVRSHPPHSSVGGMQFTNESYFHFKKTAHIKRHSCSIILFHN